MKMNMPELSSRRYNCRSLSEEELVKKIVRMKDLAVRFASLMDISNFDEASKLLADDCLYHYFEGTYVGREHIMNVYRVNEKQAAQILDEIVYTSDVEELSHNSFKVHFIDRIRIGDNWHKHHCYQLLTFSNDQIVRIEHEEIPGEKEVLVEFFRVNKRAS